MSTQFRIAAFLFFVAVAVSIPVSRADSRPTESNYRIPPQTLEQALKAFSQESGWQLFYRAELVEGLMSPGLNGLYTPQQALKKLLENSDLIYRIKQHNTITLEKRAAFGMTAESLIAASGEFLLADAEIEKEHADGPIEQEDMMVHGGEWSGYNPLNASTATKTDTPILETPLSVQVIPKTLIEDQQAIQLKDALKNISGVFTGNQSGEYGYDKFFIRGFANAGSTQIYRNGLLLPRSNNDTFNIEQIEVLKGPAAVLYGRIEPGGLINTVSKMPLETPSYSLQQQFGSFDHYRTMVDATGPLSSDNSLLYRLNIAYQNTGTFVDLVDNERILFAPSLQWRPGEQDILNFRFEYQNDDSRYYDGIPAVRGRPAKIPISTFLGWGGQNEYQKQQRIVVGYDWTHHFNEDWKIINRFSYTNLDYTFINTYYGASLAADDRTLTSNDYHYPLDQTETYATNLNLIGQFDTFNVQHRVLLGLDYYRFENHAEGYDGSALPGFPPTIDILNPIHADVPLLLREQYNSFRRSSQYWYGLYFQDQLTLFDKLHLLFGGRHDWATNTRLNASSPQAFATANAASISDTAFTPRLGILYQIDPSFSIYANYVESFGLNNGRGFNNQPLKPQTATQYEAGLKVEWLEGSLTTTLAVYHLTKENIATTDPMHPQFLIPVGEARSRGVEFDISGRITDNLSLIGSYSFTDTKIVKDNNDNNGNQGHRFANVPRHGGSLWTKYDFTGGLFDGLNFGSGIFLIGQRQGDIRNSFQLPGYIRWDLAAGYKYNIGETELALQLNINNVLNKRYFDASPAGATNIYPGIPRTFLGLIKISL